MPARLGLRGLLVANAVFAAAAFAWLGWLSFRPAVTHTRTVVVVHQGPQGPRGPRGLTGASGRRGPVGPRGLQGVAGRDESSAVAELDQRLSAVERLCGHALVADLHYGVAYAGRVQPLIWTQTGC